MTAPGKPLRVVVIEDSAIYREALVSILEEGADYEVVGKTPSGQEGIAMIESFRPDLVTCDITLPDMDGFEVVTQIMARFPTPIIVLTAALRPKWRRDAFETLSLGAVEVMEKPKRDQTSDPEWRKKFRRRLRLIALSPVIPHVLGAVTEISSKRSPRRSGASGGKPITKPGLRPSSAMAEEKRPSGLPLPNQAVEIVVAVASAGGPSTMLSFLDGFKICFPLPVPMVVALHFGTGMAKNYATFLSKRLYVPVEVLSGKTELSAGAVYLAPGGIDVEVPRRGIAHVVECVDSSKGTPSFDRLLTSTAISYGAGAAAVMLTGMSDDGALGMMELRQAGAMTAAQDEKTSIVYGMPKAAKELGAVAVEGSPAYLSKAVLHWLEISSSWNDASHG